MEYKPQCDRGFMLRYPLIWQRVLEKHNLNSPNAVECNVNVAKFTPLPVRNDYYEAAFNLEVGCYRSAITSIRTTLSTICDVEEVPVRFKNKKKKPGWHKADLWERIDFLVYERSIRGSQPVMQFLREVGNDGAHELAVALMDPMDLRRVAEENMDTLRSFIGLYYIDKALMSVCVLRIESMDVSELYLFR